LTQPGEVVQFCHNGNIPDELTGGKDVKTLTLKLDEPLYAKVVALAKRRRTTQSAVVRNAIKSCVEAPTGLGVGSALDLAKDLAGCVSGPADLSTDKAHLRGFGR
jgi:hypothetical protein